MAEPIKITLGSLDGSIKTVKVMNKLAASAVTSVAGRVGDVILSQYDVGLGNINNTSDLNKPVSIATQEAIDAITLTGDYAEVDHQHLLADITNAGTAAAADTGDFATASHTHLLGDITDAGTAAGSDIGDFAPFVHTHEMADITDLADGAISLTNKTLTDTSNVIHADQLHYKVKADENILKGQPVKYDSFNVGENAINVSLADHMLDVSIGLAEEDISQGSFGNIITAGVLDHVDTRDFTEGEILYVNGQGLLTGVEPTSGYAQPIALCLKSQQNNGALQVLADYPKQPSTDVRNDSTVSGVNVTEALDNLNTSIQSIDVDSFSITGHEHFVSDITDLLTGEFSQTGHQHVVADITDLNTGAFAEAVHDHVVADITDLNTGAFAEAVHDHVVADITDLNTGAFAEAVHDHVVADITDLNTGAFAEAVHDHVVADITDLNTGAFAEAVHDHVVADITDLNTGAFAEASHSHTASEITNDSAVAGATVKDALDTIEAGGIGGGSSEVVETSIYIDAAAFLAKDGEADASSGADNGTENSVDWYNVATAETLYAKVAMPPQWDGGVVDAEVFWTIDGGTVGENVKWEVAAQAGGNDDAWDIAFPAPTATLDDPIIANGDIHKITAESITVGGTPEDGDILHLELARATAGATAASQDARLLGVRLIYSNSLLQNWYSWKLGNETADASTGIKVTWYAPAYGKIHGIAAGCATATSGSALVLDVHKNGTTIFNTKITIDVTESTTVTAATPAVLTNDPTSFSAGDKFEFEIDSTTAGGAGLHGDLLISWN